HGTEVMVHVGINTVKNGGLGFEAHVVQGQEIKAGDKLVTVDVVRLVSEKLNPNVILVVTNDSQFKKITNLAREVKTKDVICVLKK
ncbi:PTS glucose transporter subunit IIA, partial [Mycoplasmopsis pullorum]